MWGFVVLFVVSIWVAYQVDKSRKARGQPGIPLLGHIFSSVSFNVREEVYDESLTKKVANKGGEKSSSMGISNMAGEKNGKPSEGHPKKKHKHHHKHKNRSRKSRSSVQN